MYTKFNMNIIFEGYVSCVMFPMLCVLLYVCCLINNMWRYEATVLDV